ncbi:MAG TPA: molybdenum cofactor synthesis domain-containing protein [Bacteroidales bacterium]|nr:molybdenum cofactor synthesis domain-containing protein [Bacteroidales bacterium]
MEISVGSLNISKEKGEIKHPVEQVYVGHHGLEGDAHAGQWNRQVSMLAMESIIRFAESASQPYKPGDFAENITTQGITLHTVMPLDRFLIGEAELEVTQIGKSCHGGSCAIFRQIGDCVMPKEGIFCRVINPGMIYRGNSIQYKPKVLRVFVLTLSDRASSGEYADRSGPRISQLVGGFLNTTGWRHQTDNKIIPDNPHELESQLTHVRNSNYDIMFTSGGTGIGPRDITPEVVIPMLDKQIPGIMEMIRVRYGQKMPGALLSRAVAGVMGKTLVFTLPGSVKAVEEYTDEIFRSLKHLIFMLHGLDLHH